MSRNNNPLPPPKINKTSGTGSGTYYCPSTCITVMAARPLPYSFTVTPQRVKQYDHGQEFW